MHSHNSFYNKKAIVFDYDGTLVDSNNIKFDNFFLSTKDYSSFHPRLKEIIESNPNFDRYDIFKLFGKELKLKNENIQKLIESYNFSVENEIINAPEIPGTSKILDEAEKRDLRIYINSATPRTELLKTITIRKMNIKKINIYGKPYTKIRNMKEILKIEKNSNNVLFVGDGVLDKECAFKFGIDFACIRNKSNESWSFKEVLNFEDNSALLNFLISNSVI